MWETQPLTTLRASKACRGENFTFTFIQFGVISTLKSYFQSLRALGFLFHATSGRFHFMLGEKVSVKPPNSPYRMKLRDHVHLLDTSNQTWNWPWLIWKRTKRSNMSDLRLWWREWAKLRELLAELSVPHRNSIHVLSVSDVFNTA
jgi:hypothetical protein